MKIKQLYSIYLLLIILGALNFIFGSNISKYKNFSISILRNLENPDYYDNYISIYFVQDCSYSNGFKNERRKKISFIINGENNANLTSEEALVIHKDFKIEIHFSERLKDLDFFYTNI